MSPWLVHAYTALGLVIAAWMAVLIVQGGDANLRQALQLMIVATVIDSTDGWLARRFRVKERLPEFDGRRLDDIVDFHTYTSLPMLLLWRSDLLPPEYQWLLVLPLLASIYGFSQAEAKTLDGYFLGFPSYWNVVAIYLFLVRPPEWVSLATLAVLSILTFVPTRYLYPSQLIGPWGWVANVGAVAWGCLVAVILLQWVDGQWIWISLAYPVSYMLASWWIELRFRLTE